MSQRVSREGARSTHRRRSISENVGQGRFVKSREEFLMPFYFSLILVKWAVGYRYAQIGLMNRKSSISITVLVISDASSQHWFALDHSPAFSYLLVH